MSFTAEVITALGGLTGVSTVVASVATLIQARRIHARVSPNHGSSISDATQRIEDQLAAHGETIRRIETEQTKQSADVLIARHSVMKSATSERPATVTMVIMTSASESSKQSRAKPPRSSPPPARWHHRPQHNVA